MKLRTIIVLYLSLVSQSFAAELSGEEIIQKVNDLLNPESIYARAEMTIVTTSGNERTFLYDSWSKNHGEKNLIRYIKPSRVKNQATLMLNHADDIWMYFPRTQRVRKLASHFKKQKMEGSDFSYEDIGSGNSFIDDFISKRLKDGKTDGVGCYRVELTRKPDADLSYSRLLMFIDKETYMPLLIEYYDENDPDNMIKVLHQSDIQNIQGIPTAMKMVMHNSTDNTETSMVLKEVKYHVELDDAMFSERGLKK